HVHPAVALQTGGDEVAAVVLAGDVGGHHAGGFADRLGGLARRTLVAIGEHNRRSLARERDRRRAAVADLASLGLSGAGDDRHLAGQPLAHRVSSCGSSGWSGSRPVLAISIAIAVYCPITINSSTTPRTPRRSAASATCSSV